MRNAVAVVLTLALVIACATSQGAEIQWAGNPVISLDANGVGSAVDDVVTSWTNTVGNGGNFVTLEAGTFVDKPRLETIDAGKTVKVVRFRPSLAARDAACSVLKWEQTAPASLTGEGSFSVEGWVYQDEIAQLGQVWFGWGDRNDSAGGAAVGCAIAYAWALGTGDNGGFVPVAPSTTFPLWGAGVPQGVRKFYYFATVYDSAALTVSLYVNGVLNATHPVTQYNRTADTAMFVGCLGRNGDATPGYSFEGAVAKVRVHDGVLSEAQVTSNFNLEKADYFKFAPTFDKSVPVTKTMRAGGTGSMVPPALLSPLVMSPPSTDITWSLTGTVPAGITINASTGIVTIARTVTAGAYNFSFVATNSYGTDSVAVALTIAAVPAVTVAGELLVDLDVPVSGASAGVLAAPLQNYGTLGGVFVPNNSPQIEAFKTANGNKNVFAQSGGANMVLQSDGVDIPSPEEMTGNSAWTVEGWLQIDKNFAGDCQWFGWAPVVVWPYVDHPEVHAAALLYATGGGYPAAWFSDTTTSDIWMAGWGPLNPNPVAKNGAWHHAVYTWDGTNFKTYMDGVPSANETNSNGLAIAAEQKIMLGRCYGDGGTPAYNAPNTRIAKVRVHSEALDAAGVLANYDAEKGDLALPPAPKIVITKPVASPVFGAQDPTAGPTAKVAITIRNIGIVELPAGFTVTLTGANAAEFVLDAPVTTAVPVGESRSFAVAFDPTDTAPKTAAVSINWPAGSDWTAGSVTLELYGNNAIVYIDQQNGNDATGMGTPENPWQTIAKALASTLQGDVVMMEPGVYPCDAGDSWGGRIRQVKSTQGAAETTIQASDQWYVGQTAGVTSLSFEGITFTPRAAGSGTCWTHNGDTSNFSLKLINCEITGVWTWGWPVYMGQNGRQSEFVAEGTNWTSLLGTQDNGGIAVIGSARANASVKINNCSFDGTWRALEMDATSSTVEVTNSKFLNLRNHNLNMWGSNLNAKITNCEFGATTYRGINIEGADGAVVEITGCTLHDFSNWEAIAIGNNNMKLTISDTTVTNATRDSIVVWGANVQLEMRNVRVDSVAAGAGIKVEVSEASVATLANCTVTNCAYAGVFGNLSTSTANVPSLTITDSTFVNNCTNTTDQGWTGFGAQGNISTNGWDYTNNAAAGSVLIDRCWVGSTAHQLMTPLNQAIVLQDNATQIVRNTIVEGGYRGITMATVNNADKRIENCTLIGTAEASTDDTNPDTSVAISHKGNDNYGENTNTPLVVNSIVLGYDLLDAGTAWDAASSNNIAYPESEPVVIDPKFAFQAGASFTRPAEISPITGRADYHVAKTSPAIGAGVMLPEVALDYDKLVRPNPPSIGAFDVVALAGVPVFTGDANVDGKVNIADAVCILGHLFGPAADLCKQPKCKASMDVNDSNAVDIADAVRVLSFLFAGGTMAAPDGSAIAANGAGCKLYTSAQVTLECTQPCTAR